MTGSCAAIVLPRCWPGTWRPCWRRRCRFPPRPPKLRPAARRSALLLFLAQSLAACRLPRQPPRRRCDPRRLRLCALLRGRLAACGRSPAACRAPRRFLRRPQSFRACGQSTRQKTGRKSLLPWQARALPTLPLRQALSCPPLSSRQKTPWRLPQRRPRLRRREQPVRPAALRRRQCT